jgi:predicted RNase H-like HicB family nuclease
MSAHTYSFHVFWSDEDEAYIATCPEFPSLSAFGDTPDEALREGEAVLESFIDIYREDGRPLPEPQTYSGKLNVRLPKSLHGALAKRAEQEGVSLNTLIVTALGSLWRPEAG